MRVLASIAVVPVLVVGWQLWSDHSFEQRLTPIASGIAGRSVEVDCQSLWGSLLDVKGREGEVYFDASGKPERQLFLTRKICNSLRAFDETATHAELDCLRGIDWAALDPLPYSSECFALASETIYAILILAHESYHTAGSRNEAETNCFAIQAMAWTAMQLGAPQDEAELLALAMEALEPRQGPEYGTDECHGGAHLDLHPETPEFPTEFPIVAPGGLGRFAQQ
jgi:hypothetical protein